MDEQQIHINEVTSLLGQIQNVDTRCHLMLQWCNIFIGRKDIDQEFLNLIEEFITNITQDRNVDFTTRQQVFQKIRYLVEQWTNIPYQELLQSQYQSKINKSQQVVQEQLAESLTATALNISEQEAIAHADEIKKLENKNRKLENMVQFLLKQNKQQKNQIQYLQEQLAYYRERE